MMIQMKVVVLVVKAGSLGARGGDFFLPNFSRRTLRVSYACSGINVENPDRPGGPPGANNMVRQILRRAAQ